MISIRVQYGAWQIDGTEHEEWRKKEEMICDLSFNQVIYLNEFIYTNSITDECIP